MYFLSNNSFIFTSKIKLNGFTRILANTSAETSQVEILFNKKKQLTDGFSETVFSSDHISISDKNYNQYKIYKDRIIVNYSDEICIDQISSFILSQPIGYFYFLNGFHVLHASCISYKKKAISFIGRSGAGKSSIAALMHDDRFGIIAEDLTIIDKNLNPHNPSKLIKLSSEVSDIMNNKLKKYSEYKDKRGRNFYEIYPKKLNNELSLKRCYFLNWSEKNKNISISKMENLDVFKNLLTFSYGTLDEMNLCIDFSYKMYLINKIMENSEFYIVTRPKNLDDINDSVSRLKEHIINS